MKIAGLAYRLGDRVVTNEDILALIRQHSPHYQGDIEEALDTVRAAFAKSGATERRWLAPGQRPIDMICEAVDEALDEAGMVRGDLDLVMHVGLGRGFMEAGQAAFIAQALELPEVHGFDLMDACQSWSRGLLLAHCLLAQGVYESVVVVNTECNMIEGGICYPACFQLKDRADLAHSFAGLTLADGVSATVLRRQEGSDWSFRFRSRADMADTCAVPAAGYRGFARPSTQLATNGVHHFTSYAREMNRVGYPICRDLLAELPLDGLRRVFFHGHHYTVWNAMLKEVGADPAKNRWNTYPRVGNLASACVPVALKMAADAGDIRRGERLASLVGSGGMSFSTIEFTY